MRPALYLDLGLSGNIDYEITAYANEGTISAEDGWTLSEGSSSANKILGLGSAYGTLPSAFRTGYTFDGWYSEDGTASGDWGTKIEPETVIDANAPITTLYAKWTLDAPIVSITPDTFTKTYDAADLVT